MKYLVLFAIVIVVCGKFLPQTAIVVRSVAPPELVEKPEQLARELLPVKWADSNPSKLA
jgi:hypothetical protein